MGQQDVFKYGDIGYERLFLEDPGNAEKICLSIICRTDLLALEFDPSVAGCTMPEMMLNRVDFPAPFSPPMPTMLLRANEKLTLSRTTASPNFLNSRSGRRMAACMRTVSFLSQGHAAEGAVAFWEQDLVAVRCTSAGKDRKTLPYGGLASRRKCTYAILFF